MLSCCLWALWQLYCATETKRCTQRKAQGCLRFQLVDESKSQLQSPYVGKRKEECPSLCSRRFRSFVRPQPVPLRVGRDRESLAPWTSWCWRSTPETPRTGESGAVPPFRGQTHGFLCTENNTSRLRSCLFHPQLSVLLVLTFHSQTYVQDKNGLTPATRDVILKTDTMQSVFFDIVSALNRHDPLHHQ